MLVRCLGVVAIAFGLAVGVAQAQSGGVQQELLARATVEYAPEVNGPADLYVGIIRMEPGARYGGWHSHPGSVWVIVRAGELAVYGPDGCRAAYGPGTGYVSLPDAPYDLWNEGPIPVEIVFHGVIRAGEPSTVPVVDPPTAACEM